jgi:hypothetical protein
MATEGAPSASGTVYLFGERFAKKARVGGERLVQGGAKVKLSDLADKMMVAAFVDLAGKGCVHLERVEEKKLGLFTSRDVLVTRVEARQEPLYGLDAAIWDKLTGDPKQDRVREIISRLTGGTCPNPWSIVVALVKQGLAEQGFLEVEKEVRRLRPDKVEWLANEERIVPHEGRVGEVQGKLTSLERGDAALYKQLAESVKKGLQAMVETPDYDLD